MYKLEEMVQNYILLINDKKQYVSTKTGSVAEDIK